MYKYRYLQHNVLPILADFSILLITGPRRAGKSTLAKRLLESWGGGEYFSFDTLAEQLPAKNDPQLFVQKLHSLAVLDEVQNIPEIFPYLKSFVDRSTTKGIKLILTGSQSFEMMRNIKESLAGRVLIKTLFPFSCAEAKEVALDKIQVNFKCLLEGQPLQALKEGPSGSVESAILTGGFPPLWDVTDELLRAEWLSSYTQTYIERDVRALANIRDLSVYQKFISLVAHRAARLINYSELGKDISLVYKSAKNYLSILEASFLWKSIHAYEKNIEKRLVKAAKGIFMDSGLCCFLNGINNNASLARSSQFDAIYENWVISEIIKLSSAFSPHLKFYHYRRSETFEVDLLIEVAGKVIPIEIKNSANLDKKWLKGINELIEQIGGDYIGYSYVISRYNQFTQLSKTVFNVPINSITGVS